MADVFISYAHKDKEIAERLERALERRGISVFRDTKLHLSEPWDLAIDRELKRAKCVVVVWSRASARSKQVLREASFADRQEKLLSLKIDATELLFTYEHDQYLDLRVNNGRINTVDLRRLTSEVRRKIGSTGVPAPSETPAARDKAYQARIAELEKERATARFFEKAMDLRPLIESQVTQALEHSNFDLVQARKMIEALYQRANSEQRDAALVALESAWLRNRTK